MRCSVYLLPTPATRIQAPRHGAAAAPGRGGLTGLLCGSPLWLLPALPLATVLAIVGCESGQEPAVVASVVVTPPTANLTSLGDTVRFTAQGATARGKPVADAQFTWTSSADGVATVSAPGLVTAVSNGAAIITARSGGGTGVASVTVAQRVAVVTVTPATSNLNAVGQTVQLAAAAKDARDQPVEVVFTWSSSNQAVATVSSAGLVTAAGAGSTTIVATAQGTNGTAGVTVSQLATAISITPTSALLKAVAATVQLAAVARDAGGYAIPGKRLAWTSSAPGVATVDTAGQVTAAANGSAVISAAADGVTSTVDVTVAQELVTVAVIPAAASLGTLGRSVQLAASARDANGYAIADRTFGWASAGPGVASVNAAGLVTAVANGSTSVTATTGGVTGTCIITVAQKAATVTLTPTGVLLTGAGATRQFSLAARDSGGSAIPSAGIHATWNSLIPGIATVNSSGVAAAVGAGQVTIALNVDGVVEYATLTVATPGLPRVNLWARMESGVTEKVESLWGTSATDVFATSHWRVLHYDGTAWSTAALFFGFLNMGIWGSSAQDVHVGGNAANIMHYDGTLWSTASSGLCNNIPTVWGASPRDVLGVCWDGTIVHFDGASWTSMGKPPSNGLWRVWGTARDDVWAIGHHPASPYWPLALHYDGTAWSDMTTGVTRSVLALWGTSGTNIYASGIGGNVFRYGGTGWTQIAYDGPLSVWSIWGSSASDVYFAGYDPQGRAAVLHYDGGNTWNLARGASHDTLFAVWGAPTGEVFAAGAHGSIYRGYRSGTMGLNPSVATISGGSNRLQLHALPAAGGIPMSGVPISWSSSNPNVAVVDEDGWLTGVASGTAVISAVAFGGIGATANITVDLTMRPPVALIDSPARDTTITAGEAVTFRGTATDADGTIASHAWDLGDGTTANVEDPGAHSYAANGNYRVTYRVTDNDGLSSPVATVMVNVVADQIPVVTITSPVHGASFAPGATINFTGSATDHEDGPLSGVSLVWTSSRDGQIGTGTSFTRSDLSLGTHSITLTATDSHASAGHATVTINVADTAPIATGQWTGATTGMALEFNVSADARYVTPMKYTFSGLSCGGVTLASGSVTRSTTPGWEITSRRFAIPATQNVPGVSGTFGDNGTTVTGTWTWLTCSGNWTGSH